MKKHLFSYFTLILMALIILASPLFSINLKQPNYFPGSFVAGKVLEVIKEDLQPHPALEDRVLGTQHVKVKILKGEFKNQVFEIPNPLSSEHYVFVKPGTKVIINMTLSDRKSTHLNSSHTSISYAVFCLKKKNSKLLL